MDSSEDDFRDVEEEYDDQVFDDEFDFLELDNDVSGPEIEVIEIQRYEVISMLFFLRTKILCTSEP